MSRFIAVFLVLAVFCHRTQAFLAGAGGVGLRRSERSSLRMAARPEQLPTQPKKYYIRPDRVLDVLSSAPQILLRLGSGALVDGYRFTISKEEEGDEGEYAFIRALGYKVTERGNTWERKQPRKPIEIYEFEGCPFCRKVREAVNILDLDVLFYPCPKDGPTFRPKANAMGGQKQFPYMVDPNSKTSMYESDAIINYLFDTYGEGAKAKMPKKPLELWGYESSPFTKVVREKLCELEIPHKFIASARGSPKRQQLFDLAGAGQTPYMTDPNTGAKGYESSEIVDYLEDTYAL